MSDESRSLQFYGIFRFTVFLLMGILLVKMGYSTREVSIFEKYLFYTSSLSFFISTAINKTLVANNKSYSDLPLLPLGLLCIAVASVFALLIAGNEVGVSTLLLISLLFALPFSNSLEYFLLVKKKIKEIYLLGAALHLFWLFAFFLLLYQSRSIETILRAFIVFHLIKTVLSISYLYRNKATYNFYHSTRIFLDFLAIAIIGGVMDYVDGYLVQWWFPDFDFAIFRYGAKELPLISIILTSIANGFVIKIQGNQSTWKKEMKERLRSIIIWSFPLISLLMLLSSWIFTSVFSQDYIASAQFFNLYLLLLLSRIFIGQSVLIANMKNRLLLYLGAFELILNLVLSLLFTALFGIYGILLGTIFAYLLQKVVLGIYLNRAFKLRIGEFFPIRTYLIFGSMVLASFFIAKTL